MIFDLNENSLSFANESSAFENESVITEAEVDAYFEDVEPMNIEGLDDPILVNTFIGIQTESMFRKLMDATAVEELYSIQEGTVLTESAFTIRMEAFFDNAKKIIKKIAAAVKAFFEKVGAMIKNVFLGGEKWVKENRSRLDANWNSYMMGKNKDKITGFRYDWDLLTKAGNMLILDGDIPTFGLSKMLYYIENPESVAIINSHSPNELFVIKVVGKAAASKCTMDKIRSTIFNAIRSNGTTTKINSITDLFPTTENYWQSVIRATAKEMPIKDIYRDTNELCQVIAGYSAAKKANDQVFKISKAYVAFMDKCIDAQKVIVNKNFSDADEADQKKIVDRYNSKIDTELGKAKVDNYKDKVGKACTILFAFTKLISSYNNAVHAEFAAGLRSAYSQAIGVARKVVTNKIGKEMKSTFKSVKESAGFESLEF